MCLWSRIANVFRSDELTREIDEELESHIQEAIEQGRDPVEVRRAFGSMWRRREESREIRVVAWLDAFHCWLESLRTDILFGGRQLRKNKVISTAAILSLALAVGACTSAFRLIDALLLRPLPVSQPERLYALFCQIVTSEGKPITLDNYAYPLFQQMRAAAKDQADLIAVSYANPADLTYGSDLDMERAHQQYVSGQMFSSFGLRPALGRLLTEADDIKPGGHPYAVLSEDYWAHRFGRDPNVVGRTFHMGNDLYTIVGVVNGPFTGTETGIMTDIFVPTTMYEGVKHADWGWARIFAHLKPGANPKVLLERLQPIFAGDAAEKARGAVGLPKTISDRLAHQTLTLESAGAGVSKIQQNNRLGLIALCVLVVLVLLIACANVANLMTAHSIARAREMAVRVSMGAGRWRLVQLVLLESLWLAFLASALGALFAWWSAPLIVRMINPPDHPLRLALPLDWRVFGFGVALTVAVTLIFGLAPALRASAVRPLIALKGGDEPVSRNRLMHVLIAAQVAFCFLVLFVAGLFVATLSQLSNRTTGFSAERLLTLDTVTRSPQPPQLWEQVIGHLRAVPGVETVAVAGWPLLTGGSWNGVISVNGAPPDPELVSFLNVSPGWLEAMKIPLIDGRDFRAEDTYPGVAIVNKAFAMHYFDGQDPIGSIVEKPVIKGTGGWAFARADGTRFRLQIVGLVGDARYHDIREANTPIAYVPFRTIDDGVLRPIGRATLIVRTSTSNPLALASILRQEVTRARSEFRVSNIRTQLEINQAQTVRERLIATLAVFFAGVALLLAGVGLYGVLNYSVIQRRREFGIRMAVGAQAGDIARQVTMEVFWMVITGAIAGVAFGTISVRFIEALLYQVKTTDTKMLAAPALTILLAALIAALPPVIRAVRINPSLCLRTE